MPFAGVASFAEVPRFAGAASFADVAPFAGVASFADVVPFAGAALPTSGALCAPLLLPLPAGEALLLPQDLSII
ncbi:hypothetical protein ASB57_27870 [Bordetella sp. N]|nr:hypothetical protein ASB57_27870 [Bordetella sp. N]